MGVCGSDLFWFLYFDRAGIDDKACAEAISTCELPSGDLLGQCEVLMDAKVGIHSYRRLLPANYADGLSKVRAFVFRFILLKLF